MTTASPLFGTNTALTVTGLTTLASDTNLLAGWQSGVISGATLDKTDLHFGFRFVGNTSAPTTGKQIEIYVGAVMDGAGGTLVAGGLTNAGPGTITLTAVRKQQLELVRILPTDATTSGVYALAGQNIATLFGGVAPREFVFFVVHNMGLALSAAAIYYDPINFEST